jgi:hypothetical protein
MPNRAALASVVPATKWEPPAACSNCSTGQSRVQLVNASNAAVE